ncbi:MAG: DcaP family trimeric outer membrane transporter, partial [Marinobacter sp.]|uniref:DcaP family trimeric outer membrane transporter n=1 Tax=Marinobacter sp. TaxID=50741 RepID=UPI00299DDA43
LLVQQVDVENGSVDDSAVGFATFVAAKMALTDMLTIQGALTYTDGANSYLYRSGENFGAEDAYLVNGNLETIAGYGGTIGAGINLGGGRSINIGYGLVTVDWDDAEDDYGTNAGAIIGGKSETNQNAMVNYQWSPVKNANLGVEYGYFKRENQNGDDGDAMRILFAGQYNF